MIFRIFKVQLQGENNHKFIQMKYEIKVKDFLFIYRHSLYPICVLILIDRHLNGVRCATMGVFVTECGIWHQHQRWHVAP